MDCPKNRFEFNSFFKLYVCVEKTKTDAFCVILEKIYKSTLRSVSSTQQDRQREPSVKTLRSPLSAEFWSHCVLSGGTHVILEKFAMYEITKFYHVKRKRDLRNI